MTDLVYNVNTEFDRCMVYWDDINDTLVYTRLALLLKMDLTKKLFPILFPVFNPLKTVGKYL
jgi:hypothetical protein